MRALGPCCTILESLSQFGIPCLKPCSAFKGINQLIQINSGDLGGASFLFAATPFSSESVWCFLFQIRKLGRSFYSQVTQTSCIIVITSTYNFTLFLTTFIGENNLFTNLHKFRFYIQRRRVAILSYLWLCNIVWSFHRDFCHQACLFERPK